MHGKALTELLIARNFGIYAVFDLELPVWTVHCSREVDFLSLFKVLSFVTRLLYFAFLRVEMLTQRLFVLSKKVKQKKCNFQNLPYG